MTYTRPTEKQRFQAWEAALNKSVLFTEMEAKQAIQFVGILDKTGKTKYPTLRD